MKLISTPPLNLIHYFKYFTTSRVRPGINDNDNSSDDIQLNDERRGINDNDQKSVETLFNNWRRDCMGLVFALLTIGRDREPEG